MKTDFEIILERAGLNSKSINESLKLSKEELKAFFFEHKDKITKIFIDSLKENDIEVKSCIYNPSKNLIETSCFTTEKAYGDPPNRYKTFNLLWIYTDYTYNHYFASSKYDKPSQEKYLSKCLQSFINLYEKTFNIEFYDIKPFLPEIKMELNIELD